MNFSTTINPESKRFLPHGTDNKPLVSTGFLFMSHDRFGLLSIIGIPFIDDSYRKKILVLCDCGNKKIVYLSNILSGGTRSCGCLKKGRKDGNRNTPIFKRYRQMLNRCYNAKTPYFKHYGGRGISVCEAWRNDYDIFYEWAISNGWNKNLQLDRIDNNGNYEPENCRWVTPFINSINKRSTKLNWMVVREIREKYALSIGLKAIAVKYNISVVMVHYIVHNKKWKE